MHIGPNGYKTKIIGFVIIRVTFKKMCVVRSYPGAVKTIEQPLIFAFFYLSLSFKLKKELKSIKYHKNKKS